MFRPVQRSSQRWDQSELGHPGFHRHALCQTRNGRDETKQRIPSRVPMGRPGSPEEVASIIAHLASDDAAYTTGGAFFVDGDADTN